MPTRRRPEPSRLQKKTPPFAIIDVGSNSVRLVVYQLIGAFPISLFNESVSCRLGRGLAKTGRLHPAGVELAVINIRRFFAMARAMGVTRIEAVGTAAVREAADAPAFLRRIRHDIGLSIRVLSGDEEAEASARGVLAGIYDARGLAADMGGASMEIAAVTGAGVGRRITLPLGPLRALEAGGGPGGLRALDRRLAETLSAVAWLETGNGRDLYLVGGAWRALARAHMHLTGYPVKMVHYLSLSRADAIAAADTILRVDPTLLAAIPRMSRKRIDTMPYAALAVRQLVRHAAPEQVVFSTYGLREGWVFGDFAPNRPGRDWFLQACRDYSRWAIGASLPGEDLAAWIEPVTAHLPAAMRRLVLGACFLSNLGWADHPEDRAYHVLSRCLRLAVPGIDHRSRAFIALAAYRRYGGNLDDDRIRKFDPLLTRDEKLRAILIGTALRLAYALTGGNAEMLAATSLSRRGDILRLSLARKAEALVGDGVTRRFGDLVEALGGTGEIVTGGHARKSVTKSRGSSRGAGRKRASA